MGYTRKDITNLNNKLHIYTKVTKLMPVVKQILLLDYYIEQFQFKKSKFPSHDKSFKMVLSDQLANGKV